LEFSFDKQNDSDTSNIANERLRKAIERNRQRQKEREQQEQKAQPTQATQSAQYAQRAEQTQQAQTQFRARPQTPPPPPPQFEQAPLPETEPIIEEPKPTRRTVARPQEETEFVAVKRTTKRAAPALNYHTTSTHKKSKPWDPAIVSFLTKAAWIFAIFLVLRLAFAKGGMTDFYAQHKLLNQRQSELLSIKTENMQMVREIERMYTDAGYQKKLVRDNLGFIAADEFLVLFPKD
jgi:cell division protein FtsB